jgi:hypothetical protein
MKEQFEEHKFNNRSLELLAAIDMVLQEYEQQGFDLSLRQLYYQLVARNLLPEDWADRKTGSTNNVRSYGKIGTLVSNARLAGLIDWDLIKDRGRQVIQHNHFDSVSARLRFDSKVFRIDLWENQDVALEVMVEKQALEGVLVPVCQRLDVAFTANKGYSSSSALYEAAQRALQRYEDRKQQTIILYLGDHDPSGMDMTRDVLQRMELFTGDAGIVDVDRIALNYAQVKMYNPPPNPAKETDARFAAYAAEFGTECWELDALEPAVLAGLVERSVLATRDGERFSEQQQKQEQMRTQLLRLSEKTRMLEIKSKGE